MCVSVWRSAVALFVVSRMLAAGPFFTRRLRWHRYRMHSWHSVEIHIYIIVCVCVCCVHVWSESFAKHKAFQACCKYYYDHGLLCAYEWVRVLLHSVLRMECDIHLYMLCAMEWEKISTNRVWSGYSAFRLFTHPLIRSRAQHTLHFATVAIVWWQPKCWW